MGWWEEKCNQLDGQADSDHGDLSPLNDDVVDTAHSPQPFPHSLTDSDVSHVTGQLADAREHRWLERCEGLVWKDLNLIENG